jgi:hypothetical protein
MTLHQIKSMADIIHYIESVDDEELKVIPQDQFAHALKALFTDGYFAYRSFNQNVLLINSFRDSDTQR